MKVEIFQGPPIVNNNGNGTHILTHQLDQWFAKNENIVVKHITQSTIKEDVVISIFYEVKS